MPKVNQSSVKAPAKLLKSTGIVAFMTMLSRLLGFVRDMIFADIFGAGAAFDAFVIAFKFPNFLRRLFGEGAFSQAFVPVLSEYQQQKTREEVQAFVDHIAGVLGIVLTGVVLLAEIAAPGIIAVFAPGYLHDPVRFALATHMLHWTAPYLLLIALTAFSGAILNTYRQFAVPAFTPVLLNITFIVIAYFWAPHTAEPIVTLSIGVVIAGVIQAAFQVPFLMRVKLLPLPRWGFRDAGVMRVMTLMVPALFGVSVAQIGLLVDNFFASYLPAGSISWLYYSDRLTYLPLGVIGVALATVVLPHLSRKHIAGDTVAYGQAMDWALRQALLIGLPAAIGLGVLAGPILVTLIHHGAFNVFDVLMTRRALWAFSAGLPAFMLIKVLASGYYARQNIKTPVRIAAIALGVNVGLNFALIHPLAHAGLALATSIAAMLNAACLWILLVKKGFYQPQEGWMLFVGRIVIACGVMGALIFWWGGDLSAWLDWTMWPRILHLLMIIVGGFIAYVLCLMMLGFRIQHIKAPQ